MAELAHHNQVLAALAELDKVQRESERIRVDIEHIRRDNDEYPDLRCRFTDPIDSVESDTGCIGCGVAGYVRRERIVSGMHVELEYTCGACRHVWRAPDARKRVDRRRVTRRESSRRKR